MKIRSESDLNDFLNEESSWRKRELSTIFLLTSSRRAHEQQAMLRSSVCILYAHWEGYIKNTATCYLNYVALKGLKYRDLTPNFVALGIRSQLQAAEKSNRMTIHMRVTEFLLSDLRQNASLPWSNAVSTKDNLNSDVLQEVLCLLNIDYTPYETKKVIIDEKLLGHRNKIAHGERIHLDIADYEEIYAEIVALMDMFRNDVENAALTKAFLRGS